jgi:hypothetical protein
MYIRPGFVVVMVGGTLTALSTVVVALRYDYVALADLSTQLTKSIGITVVIFSCDL